MSSNSLLTNAAWSTINHLFARGSLVVASMILARNLDSSGFAAYSLFHLTISMLASYAALGLGVTASRFFAEFQGTINERSRPIGALWLISIIGGGVAYLITLFLPNGLIEGDLDIPRWLLALGVFSISLGVVPAGGVLGLEQYKNATVVACFTACFLIVGSYYASEFHSPISAMWILIFSNLINALGNLIVILRVTGLKSIFNSARISKSNLQTILTFAGPMVGVSLLSASGSWLVGRIILSGPSGAQNLALYAIGVQWMALALFLPGMVSRVLLPRLVRVQFESRESNGTSRNLVGSSVALVLLLAVVVAIIGALLSPWLIRLYGPNYAINQWILSAFLLAAIPSAPANTLGNAIVARNGQLIWLAITCVWFVMLIGLTIALSPIGVWAGALSHGLASTILTLLSVYFARKKGLLK